MATPQNAKLLLGEMGELLVLSRLTSLGLIAGQLPRNWKQDDLWVERGRKLLRVQVKTHVGTREWGTGLVEGEADRFFAFVFLNSLDALDILSPVVYVMSSMKVGELVAKHHELYLMAHPNMKGNGYPGIADKWNRNDEMSALGYCEGWIEDYREPWERFKSGKTLAQRPKVKTEVFSPTPHRLAAIPGPHASSNEINLFSATYNGYKRLADGPESLELVVHDILSAVDRGDSLGADYGLDRLRGTLFYLVRKSRFGIGIDEDVRREALVLIDAIRHAAAGLPLGSDT